MTKLRDLSSYLALAAFAITGLSVPSTGVAAAGPSGNVLGLWYDSERKGAVSIAKCGANLCGQIVWLRNPLRRDGNPKVDVYNSAKSMRTRPICGLQVLGALKPTGGSKWVNGWVYNPKKGKRYRAQITLKNNRTLHMRGYLRYVALGKTKVWTRAPQSLKRCLANAGKNDTQAEKKPAGKNTNEQKRRPDAQGWSSKRPANNPSPDRSVQQKSFSVPSSSLSD